MQSLVDEQLASEIETYRLRYDCENCSNFEPDSGTCSLDYPNEAHRARLLVIGSKLTFCKEFDLG